MLNSLETTNTLKQTVTLREKFVGSVIAFIALVLVGLVSIKTVGLSGFPFMVASMGASSVLLFAVPYSPLSQPWPFIGGHLVSSSVGVTCALFIPDPVLAAAAAVSLAIAAMHVTRCLHPPGGAVALAAVLGGQQIHGLGYQFVLFPVMVNATLLLGAALLLNNMVPGRRYPSRGRALEDAGGGAETWADLANGLSGQDLHAAINSLDEFVDIGEEQLNKVYKATVLQMRKRQLGDVRCEQVMSREVISLNEQTPIFQAWRRLQNARVKAAPVVDNHSRVIGIVTQTDLAKLFMDNLSVESPPLTSEVEVKRLRTTPLGKVMSTPVTTIGAERHIVDVIPLFVEHNIHHLPVVDGNRVILGLLTRSDLLTLWALKSSL